MKGKERKGKREKGAEGAEDGKSECRATVLYLMCLMWICITTI